MQKVFKVVQYGFVIICLFSCKPIKINNFVNRDIFPELFLLDINTRIIKNDSFNSYNTQLNKNKRGEISKFIQTYPIRFEYIINNALDKSFSPAIKKDTATIKKSFSAYLVSNDFYRQFTLLTNTSRNNLPSRIHFTKKEYFHTASLFFMCDEVNKKDTSINYHICVGINGISKVDKTNEKLALQAICIEAIFKNIQQKQPPLLTSFNSFINKVTALERSRFRNFNNFLQNVKTAGFHFMENDKAFQLMLMNYYDKNIQTLNFFIL